MMHMAQCQLDQLKKANFKVKGALGAAPVGRRVRLPQRKMTARAERAPRE